MSKAQRRIRRRGRRRTWTALRGQRLSLAIQFAAPYEIINELGYGDGAATTAARGAAAEAAMNVDVGTSAARTMPSGRRARAMGWAGVRLPELG